MREICSVNFLKKDSIECTLDVARTVSLKVIFGRIFGSKRCDTTRLLSTSSRRDDATLTTAFA